MKALKITPEVKKKFKSTTDSNHNEPIAPNILDRKFEVAETKRVWESGITYIRVSDSFTYLGDTQLLLLASWLSHSKYSNTRLLFIVVFIKMFDERVQSAIS